jgi:hypothetical protein
MLTLIFEMGNDLKGHCPKEFRCLTIVIILEKEQLDASYVPAVLWIRIRSKPKLISRIQIQKKKHSASGQLQNAQF